MSICLSPARGEASRRNGAKSRGPRTPEGKARSAQNALRHGLCAQKHLVLADEDAQAFAALEASIIAELAPEGTLQHILAARVVRAAWRLERAERIETELFELRRGDGNLALALIRDGNGTRAFDTLLRYRGSALAEFFRTLRLLQALQDQARAIVVPAPARTAPSPQPNEPKHRRNPDESGRAWSIGPGAGLTHVARRHPGTPGPAASSGPRPPGSCDQGSEAVPSRSS
jgi:hypothetical protein